MKEGETTLVTDDIEAFFEGVVDIFDFDLLDGDNLRKVGDTTA